MNCLSCIRSGILLFGFILVIAIILPRGVTHAAAPERAGTATAAVPQIDASLKGRSERSVTVGNSIFHDERLKTGPNGLLHALLLDESNLTLGPGSEIVINEFVYNSNTGVGKLLFTHSSGVLRFIGGQLSKTGDVTVDTNKVTIGIRGGIVIIASLPNGNSKVFFLYGDGLTGSAASGGTFTLQPGFAVTIGVNGSFGPPEPIDFAELAGFLSLLDRPSITVTGITIPDDALRKLQNQLNTTDQVPTSPFDGLPKTQEVMEEIFNVETVDDEAIREVYEKLKKDQEPSFPCTPFPSCQF